MQCASREEPAMTHVTFASDVCRIQAA